MIVEEKRKILRTVLVRTKILCSALLVAVDGIADDRCFCMPCISSSRCWDTTDQNAKRQTNTATGQHAPTCKLSSFFLSKVPSNIVPYLTACRFLSIPWVNMLSYYLLIFRNTTLIFSTIRNSCCCSRCWWRYERICSRRWCRRWWHGTITASMIITITTVAANIFILSVFFFESPKWLGNGWSCRWYTTSSSFFCCDHVLP